MKHAKPASSTDDVAAQLTEELKERIRQRAYELYEARDRQDGHEIDDCLQAESRALQEIKQ